MVQCFCIVFIHFLYTFCFPTQFLNYPRNRKKEYIKTRYTMLSSNNTLKDIIITGFFRNTWENQSVKWGKTGSKSAK